MTFPIGELFMLGFRGPELPTWLRDFARQYGLGGVILFDYDCTTKKYERNIFNPHQVRTLCQEIHALPSAPRVYVDQEGGKVRRFKEKYGFKNLPSAKNYAQMNIVERKSLLSESLRELREVGVDVNLAPVIDLDYNALSPDLGKVERSFSVLPSIVHQCVAEWIEISHSFGVQLCLKHYPGCGAAKTNSHDELMDLSNTLREEQLQLFDQLIPQIGMVLLSHGLVEAWDPGVPVCLSKAAVRRIRAKGPEAILVTDDLQMAGMQKIMTTSEACKRALHAGLDLICIGNNLLDQQTEAQRFAEHLLSQIEREPAVKAQAQAALARLRRLKSR